jgi:hypothetical protein
LAARDVPQRLRSGSIVVFDRQVQDDDANNDCGDNQAGDDRDNNGVMMRAPLGPDFSLPGSASKRETTAASAAFCDSELFDPSSHRGFECMKQCVLRHVGGVRELLVQDGDD